MIRVAQEVRSSFEPLPGNGDEPVEVGGERPHLETVGRVVAEVAQEARNPLASILANLETWGDERGAESISTACASAARPNARRG